MGRGSAPGELEQLVLLVLAGFERDATSGQVYEAIVEATGRDISLAAVHITLTRVGEKGWATVRTAVPQPGRGGKPTRHYRLSPEGARLLVELREQFQRLWAAARDHPLVVES